MLIPKTQYCQIQNGEFNQWYLVEGIGQPYEDLVSWQTNNENDGGLATTPNVEILVDNDSGVSITANYSGTDGKYSGKIKQTITSDNLISIRYLSKCDSIYDRGACVVNIYNENKDLLYTDSIKQKETNYKQSEIKTSELELVDSDSITIEFVSFGQIGYFEDFQAYSEFNLLGVFSDYITNTSEIKRKENVVIYPNPFKDKIRIEIDTKKGVNYNLYNSDGIKIRTGSGREIETSKFQTGIFFLEVIIDGEVEIKKIIKH